MKNLHLFYRYAADKLMEPRLRFSLLTTFMILGLFVPVGHMFPLMLKPEMEWENIFAECTNKCAYVQQTSDGGYICLGYRLHHTNSYDIYLFKIDPDGEPEWKQFFGGKDEDYSRYLIETSDGGYAIVGRSYSYGPGSCSVYLIKTDAAGNMQWSKTYGGRRIDTGLYLLEEDDGGFVIVGSTQSFNEKRSLNELYLIRTDVAGGSCNGKRYNYDGHHDTPGCISAENRRWRIHHRRQFTYRSLS